jgi:Zn2+/Cd2+-exporting ATPase
MKPTDHELTAHSGILSVSTDPGHACVDVEFDPAKLSDGEVRTLLKEHISQVETAIRKSTFRLEGSACEACAMKLEKKIRRIPGVRRATATYLGRVLSITFDSEAGNESIIATDLKKTGANIRPFVPRSADKRRHWQKIRDGEHNDEISCGLGFLFLLAALVVGKTAGHAAAENFLYLLAYIFAGQQGVCSAIASLREKVLDVDVLMVLAALGAALIGAPFEGALLLFLFSLSNVLQRHAMERTQRAIEALLTLRPSW